MQAKDLQQATKYINRVFDSLIDFEAKRATKYISPTLVVSVQRRLFKANNGKIDRRDRTAEFVVKIGKPNYKERAFVKACKQAGEKFPVQGIQLQFPPERKKGKK